MAVRFSEKQELLSSWLATIMLIAAVGGACLQYYYFSGHEEMASTNLPVIILLYFPLIFIMVWLYYGKMELTIDDSELKIDMWRFSKTIPLSSISKCQITDVHIMKDFGGVGYRVGGSGEGYIYPGQPRGVVFSYVGGAREVVISSRRPEELLNALCTHNLSRAAKTYTAAAR